MKAELEKLAAAWEREARQYRDSAAMAGLVDGAHPKEQTEYQSICATNAGVYQNCAHKLRVLIKNK